MIRYGIHRNDSIISPVSYVLWDWAGTITVQGSINRIAYHWIYAFKDCYIEQYVISNESSLSTLTNSIKSVHLDHLFQNNVICVGHGYLPKPNRSMYDAFLGRVENTSSHEVVFIGDSELDSEFARNSGCHFIHISYINQYEIGECTIAPNNSRT